MFKRKSSKKIQEEIKQEMENSKSAITQIVDSYQEFEIYNAEAIGNKVDFNYPRVYIYMLCSYGEDIVTLINNERYASLYTLLNNFLECYGLGKNLVAAYFDEEPNKYKETLEKYYAATLEQRKCECNDFDEDFALNYEDEVRFYDIRFEQMEKIIKEFFQHHSDDLAGEDRDLAIYEIVDKIIHEMDIPLDVEGKVIKALQTNGEFSEEEVKRAIATYISAKSASLNNVQTVLTRILGMVEGRPALLLNKNEGISPKVLNIVEKCLRDITDMVVEGFNF